MAIFNVAKNKLTDTVSRFQLVQMPQGFHLAAKFDRLLSINDLANGDLGDTMARWACLLLILAIASGISGCAYVPLADRDANRAAKTFATRSGLANIYIYRNESIGKAIAMPVLLDGVVIGETAKKTFILRQVHPGRHTLISRTENDSRLDVVAVAGQNYFVWQEVKLGTMKANSKLQLVDEAVGKKAIKKCDLIE